MENQIDNTLRAFTARRSANNVSQNQLANSSFLQHGYQDAWNFHGPNNDVLNNLAKLIQALLQRLGNGKCCKNEYRSADGSGNNQNNPDWGSTYQMLNRTRNRL
ncbi:MAG: hypothetical protein R3E89_10065 [Thiolinea sp.]